MSRDSAATADAILRNDLGIFTERCFRTLHPDTPFLRNWHHEAIAYRLEQVRRGEITRLIINLPPRYLKSLMVSVAFPAFMLGHKPGHRIFGLSYGQELSEKLGADFRTIVESPWYRRAFPQMIIKRSVADEVTTTRRGFRKSSSVMGTLTGLGGDLFIIDDPQKAVDAQSETKRSSLNQWISNTLMSRLDNKRTGAIIVVMQRLHMNDLSGYLIDGSDDWSVLSLPALGDKSRLVRTGFVPRDDLYLRAAGEPLHSDLENEDDLLRLRETLGTEIFSAQYEQKPVPAGGTMIKRDWLRYYRRAPDRTSAMKVIQSWDTAAKGGAQNSWSVCTTWLLDKGNYYLLDLARGRYNYPDLKEVAEELADRYEPNVVLIEDASTGMALAQELQLLNARVELVRPDADKEARLYVNQAKFERGLVHFPEGASFLPALESELLAFPYGTADDQVDSITQALSHKFAAYDPDIVNPGLTQFYQSMANRTW
jgi:predicted phage terminase large subunit-like protein